MKIIIRYLANISGVEQEIRDSERTRIGAEFESTSYWFTDYKKYPYIYPFLKAIGTNLKKRFYVRGDLTRDYFDFLSKNDPSISHHLQKVKELKDGYKTSNALNKLNQP